MGSRHNGLSRAFPSFRRSKGGAGLDGRLLGTDSLWSLLFYRPQRTAHEAVARVAQAIELGKTRVIDADLAASFDTVRHDRLLGKVARRIQDPEILPLLKRMLKASGKRGVSQGGVISPLLANIYLTEVDAMLERAKEVTRGGEWPRVEYARYADDLVILVDGYRRHAWLRKAVEWTGGSERSSPDSICD